MCEFIFLRILHVMAQSPCTVSLYYVSARDLYRKRTLGNVSQGWLRFLISKYDGLSHVRGCEKTVKLKADGKCIIYIRADKTIT